MCVRFERKTIPNERLTSGQIHRLSYRAVNGTIPSLQLNEIRFCCGFEDQLLLLATSEESSQNCSPSEEAGHVLDSRLLNALYKFQW